VAVLDTICRLYTYPGFVFVSPTSYLLQTHHWPQIAFAIGGADTNPSPEFMSPSHTYHNTASTTQRLQFNHSYSRTPLLIHST
jgi:hypothetical protein